jgi:hypothetical protein
MSGDGEVVTAASEIEATADLFGRIAQLASLIVEVSEEDFEDAASMLDAVACIAVQIGAVADTATVACGGIPVRGEAGEWLLRLRPAQAIEVLKARRAEEGKQ